jgi:2-polyprenyl-3-methyl-5-hydroxy-6-metoxy-1,4-benzoquinol methylase
MRPAQSPLQQVRERRFLIDSCDAWIYQEIAPYLGRRVLEVGCGLGNLLSHLLDRELVVGIDPDVASIEFLRQTYSGKTHVQVHPFDICDLRVMELSASRFDTVVSLNVFEHIEDDVLALRHVRDLLEPGGHLVLIVPAHSWLYGTMDRAIGHYRRYDKAPLHRKLAAAGLAPAVMKYMNALGVLGWLLNGKVLRRQVPPSGQLRLFNRIVPLVRAIERRLPPPFGLSLLAIAR